MKILFLNPHVDAEHNTLQLLKSRGLAILQPNTPDEAWQLLQLHGTSVELAILHREFPNDPEGGLKLLAKIKKDETQSDLPVILTSEAWGDGEFASHQSTPQGANAYSRWPLTGEELVSLIEAVFGEPLPAASAPQAQPVPPPVKVPSAPPSRPPAAPAETGGLVLEDASNLFSRSGKYEASDTSIRLEAPELEPEPGHSGSISIPTAISPAEAGSAGSGIALSSPAEGEPAALELSSGPAQALSLEQSEGIPLETAEPSELSSSEAPSIPTASASVVSEILLQAGEPDGGVESVFDPSALSIAPDEPAETGGQIDTQAALQAIQVAPRDEQPAEPQAEASGEVDREVAQEMPYLFGKGGKSAMGLDPAVAYAQPMGDAVVPGGAAQSPDTETLKKYLLLREQDVAVLSTQLKTAREQVQTLEEIVREERARNVEASHTINEQRRKIEEFEKDKAIAVEGLQGEIGELRFQLKAKADKARVMEAQVREATDEMERLKERVRSDIRKIRVREKELENRLEIMKKDSEALIAAREGKIIELKRKLDLLEFNMDLLQDQYAREKENSAKLRERLAKAAQVVRVAGGLLDQNGKPVVEEPTGNGPSGGGDAAKREAS